MQYSQEPICKLIPQADYIHFVCAKCNQACQVQYKGLDPAIPRIEIVCHKCGSLGQWKIEQGRNFPKLS